MSGEEGSQAASSAAGAGASLAVAVGLPVVGFALAAVQIGLQFAASKRASAKSRRQQRQQQTRNNLELIRRAQALGEQEARPSAEQRALAGAAGARGGGVLQATNAADLANQRRLGQELLLRGVDESLQKGARRLGLFGGIAEDLNQDQLRKKNAPIVGAAEAAANSVASNLSRQEKKDAARAENARRRAGILLPETSA